MKSPGRGHAPDMAQTDHRLTNPHDDARRDDADAAEVRSPRDLTKESWIYVLRKTASEFSRDEGTDLAAALTYYSVLALFPPPSR